MSERLFWPIGNLLSAFVSMIGGAICVGIPLTIAIIWICS